MPIDPLLTATFATMLYFLVVKAQVLAAATAARRGQLKRYINAEDATWLQGQHLDRDGPSVARIGRAHRNDLEALLPFAIVGTLYVLSGASALWGYIYFVLFGLARLAHTFAYLFKRPALRRNAFTLAWLLSFVIGAHALVSLIPRLLAETP